MLSYKISDLIVFNALKSIKYGFLEIKKVNGEILKFGNSDETLKVFLEKLPNIKLVRMTGSGSAMIAYFSSSKLCKQAEKKVKTHFKKYWCKRAKTM